MFQIVNDAGCVLCGIRMKKKTFTSQHVSSRLLLSFFWYGALHRNKNSSKRMATKNHNSAAFPENNVPLFTASLKEPQVSFIPSLTMERGKTGEDLITTNVLE